MKHELNKEKLNIVMISHHHNPARPRPIAQHLVSFGHKVTIMQVAERRKFGIVESKWKGVKIVETPDLLWGRLRTGWDIWNTLNRIFYIFQDNDPFDILHCFETRPATIYPALFFLRKHNVPFITDWNDWWGRGGLIEVGRPKWYRYLFGGIETYYEEHFRSSADGLTVISTALAERAVKLGVQQKSICYLPGGTTPKEIEARSKNECRNQVGLPTSDPILGYMGTFHYLDIEIVLEALAVVSKKFPSVKLILTGNVGKKVLELSSHFQVENNVYQTGFLPKDELPLYLGCCDVFLLPFANEIYNIGRWPNKIGLYMCLERPTVTNPVGDIATLFEQYNIGLLAKWDPDDFAKKIITLIEQPELADRLGKSARELAITDYDWDILVKKLESFYFSLLT